MFEQVLVRMCPISDGETVDAGILRHQQVVRGIADHQRCRAGDAEFGHQFFEHLRVRLGMALIGATRCLEQRAQTGMVERPLQAGAALAGGNRLYMPGCLQFAQQFRDAGEQI